MINKECGFFVISALLAAVAQVFLKHVSMEKGYFNKNKLQRTLNIQVVTAYTLLLSTTYFNLLGYRNNSLAIGAIINSLSYVLVAFFSNKLFGENFTKKSVLAYMLIISGVVIAVT